MQPILIVCAALAIERLVTISSSIDPLAFFRFVCQRMASKVMGRDYSSEQLVISGSLALLMLVLPLLVIVYLVLQIASYQWLLDILLLYLLIQFTNNIKVIRKGLDALDTGKNQLAKALLQQVVLRNTQSLSSLGLAKASLETTFLRYHHQQFTIILCYLVLGPIPALCYRLCYEASQVWNLKFKKFMYFGRLSNAITQAFQLIPSLIMSISFLLISSPKALMVCIQQKQLLVSIKQAFRFQGNQSLLLRTLSSALNNKTGGPVIYGSVKKQRARFALVNSSLINATKGINELKPSLEPTTDSVKTLISLVNRHLIVTVLITTWILFWYFPN